MDHAVQSRRYQVQEVVLHLDAHQIRFHTKHTQKPPSFFNFALAMIKQRMITVQNYHYAAVLKVSIYSSSCSALD
jgi:hypothetical protein